MSTHNLNVNRSKFYVIERYSFPCEDTIYTETRVLLLVYWRIGENMYTYSANIRPRVVF